MQEVWRGRLPRLGVVNSIERKKLGYFCRTQRPFLHFVAVFSTKILKFALQYICEK